MASCSTLSAASLFPWATLTVNTLGCLAIGAIAGLAEQTDNSSGQLMRLFLLTGVLGGFTTFSAFGFETYALAQGHLWSAALLSVGLHLYRGAYRRSGSGIASQLACCRVEA